MSTTPLMLDGLVSNKSRGEDDEMQPLRRENQRLEAEVRQLRAEMEELRAASESAQRVIRNLRDQLNPLHRALRAVFGEIELALGEEGMVASSAGPAPERSSSIDPRWESWKAKLPGRPAEMINVLLLHRDMSTKQLMAAMHCGKDTVYQTAYKLSQVGLISNMGGRYSLKSL